MVDTVFTQMRCERTALDVNYGAGAPPIFMRGTMYVKSVGQLADIADLDGARAEQMADDERLHGAVDPPAYVRDAADAPGPQFDVAAHCLLWMSYRRGFAALEGTHITSDNGWGCMLRSGQMLLAQTLVLHCLGDSWLAAAHRYDSAAALVRALPDAAGRTLRHIASLFVDHPQCPFSVHCIARLGAQYGVKVGTWFSPTPVSLALRDLVCAVEPAGLTCVVARDATVCLDEVRAAFRRPLPERPNFFCEGLEPLQRGGGGGGGDGDERGARGLLLVVPVRLGLASLDASCAPQLAALFRHPQFVGVVGGQPHSSLFFFASQGTALYFLNPHVVQPALEPAVPPHALPLDSYLPKVLRRVDCSRLDPSLALGLYFRDERDFDGFLRDFRAGVHGRCDLFCFEDTSRAASSVSAREVSIQSNPKNSKGKAASKDGDDGGDEKGGDTEEKEEEEEQEDDLDNWELVSM